MEDEARRRDRDCFMAKTAENPPLSDGRVRGRDYSSVTLRWAIATKQICQALCLSEVSDGELTLKTRGSSPTPLTLNWIRVRKYMDRWSIQPSIGETTRNRIESKHQDKNDFDISMTPRWATRFLRNAFHSLSFTHITSWYYFQKIHPQPCKKKTSKLPLGNHYLSDKLWLLHSSFPLCYCCYRNQSATSSLKCEGPMLFPIHLLEALKSFSTVSCLASSFLCVWKCLWA